MVTTTENSITRRILKHLNGIHGCRAMKLHVSRYGVAGTPDILCCHKGRTYFFEVKAPGREPTGLQLKQMGLWEEAGAVCRVVHGADDLPEELQ